MVNRNYFLFFVVIVFALFSVSASVLSVDSGGFEGLVMNTNAVDEFFFSGAMTLAVCGNGDLETGEGCDDGNIVSGDGCSASCAVEGVGGGGGGGGGGGVEGEAQLISTLSGLLVVPESLNLPATVGIQTSAKLSLTNNYESDLELSWSVESLGDIISIDPDVFVLRPGETRVLEFFIMPNESGIFSGKFIFSSEEGIHEMAVVLNVNSRLSLFDVILTIPEDMKVVFVGEKVVGDILLTQMGLVSDVDVVVNYIVQDFSGKVYLTQTETIKVNKEKSYSHIFETNNLLVGDYIIGVEVVYTGGIAVASSQFKIVSRYSYWWILILILLIILIIILFFALKKLLTSIRDRLL